MKRMPRLVVAALILAGSVFATQPTGSRAADPVTAWIELGSTRPEVGCFVPVAIEVRSNGAAFQQNEVSIGFFINDELHSIDTDITNSEGVGVLAFDTSEAWVGASGWLDISVSGRYLTGVSIAFTSSGGCEQGGKSLTIEGEAPNLSVDTFSSSSAGGFVTYKQQRSLSCEYAAIQIATTAWGDAISEYSLDAVVGYSDNPHWGFRGDISGRWGNTHDYGVYPSALSAALPQFGYVGDVFYGQGSSRQLTAWLDDGVPVLVWIATVGGDEAFYDYAEDGSRYKLVPKMHVVVAYDYDEEGIWVSDPGRASLNFYTWSQFKYMWNVLDGMSLAVYPA